MEILKRSEPIRLILAVTDPPATRWSVSPRVLDEPDNDPVSIVDLVPANDGRSCLATPKGVGTVSVRAYREGRGVVGIFWLKCTGEPLE